MRTDRHKERYAYGRRTTVTVFLLIYFLYLRTLQRQWIEIARRIPRALWFLAFTAIVLAAPRLLAAIDWTTDQLVALFERVEAEVGPVARVRLLTMIDLSALWLAVPLTCSEPYTRFYSRCLYYFHQTHRQRNITAWIIGISSINTYVFWMMALGPVTWLPFAERLTGQEAIRRLLVDVLGIGVCVLLSLVFSSLRFWLEARQARLAWLWATAVVCYVAAPAAAYLTGNGWRFGKAMFVVFIDCVHLSDPVNIYLVTAADALIWMTICGVAIPVFARTIALFGGEHSPQ